MPPPGEVRVGDNARLREGGRWVTYHVRKVEPRGLVEGVVLNDDDFMVSAFLMSRDAWERLRAGGWVGAAEVT